MIRISSNLFLILSVSTAIAACQQDPQALTAGPVLSRHDHSGDGGFVTSQPAQARPLVPQATMKPILTTGDLMPGSNQPWAPTPDGLGAYAEGSDLVVFANHEITAAGVTSSNGGDAFKFSRVSRLVLDPEGLVVKSGRYVEDGITGLIRLCSATWVGWVEGFSMGLFLTGEENGPTAKGSLETAFDGEGNRTELPHLGALSHENAFAVPGFRGKIVTFETDDAAGQSELYMYVANNEQAFLQGAGKLYVFKTDVKAPSGKNLHSGNLVEGQPVDGYFVEISDPADLGAVPSARFDRLQTKVDALGAFPFVRLEDGDYDKGAISDRRGEERGERDEDNRRPAFYFVDTGSPSVTGRAQVNADCGGVCDLAGSLYRMELDPSDPTQHAKLVLLQRSQGQASGWASPDNIATTRKSIMLMEDPAYNGFDGSRAPGIWNARFRDHGRVGTFQEVVEVTQEQLIPGPGGKCVDATGLCWETSGIISTEQWLGSGTWLFDVQAHTLPFAVAQGGSTFNYSKESGQLLYLRLPGS
jgi:hypothetical protein